MLEGGATAATIRSAKRHPWPAETCRPSPSCRAHRPQPWPDSVRRDIASSAHRQCDPAGWRRHFDKAAALGTFDNVPDQGQIVHLESRGRSCTGTTNGSTLHSLLKETRRQLTRGQCHRSRQPGGSQPSFHVPSSRPRSFQPNSPILVRNPPNPATAQAQFGPEGGLFALTGRRNGQFRRQFVAPLGHGCAGGNEYCVLAALLRLDHVHQITGRIGQLEDGPQDFAGRLVPLVESKPLVR